MAKEVNAGSASIDFRVARKKMKEDLNEIKRDLTKEVASIESIAKDIRIDFDERFAKMKLAEVKKVYAAFKKQMEQKIKFGADEASIEKTAVAMDAARARIKSFGNEGEVATRKVGEGFKRIAAYLLTFVGVRSIGRFIEDSSKLYASQLELESSFKGSSRELNLFSKATSEALSRADLIKLSNQATDLGVSLEDQAIFFLMAKKAASKYGEDVSTSFRRIVTASEGELEGVKKVGIQQKVYQLRIRELAKEHGALIENLDAETQKRIRLKAILDSSGLSMKDVENKTMSLNEQMQAIPSLVVDIKTSFGGFFSKLLIDWLPNGIESLKDFNRRLRELTIGRGELAAEGISYDFSGTDEVDRAILIKDWYVKIAEEIAKASAAKTKFVKYEMSNEEMEAIAVSTATTIATYQKLIELAKNYKEELDSPTKIIKTEDTKLQKEFYDYKKVQQLKIDKTAEYYETMKFLDESYFQWKTEQYIRDFYSAVQAGADKYQQEVLLNEKIKKLIEERSQFEKDNTSPELRGKTIDQIYDQSENRKSWRTKAMERREAEEKQLDENTESAETFADVLSSGLTQGIISSETLGSVLANLGIQLAGMVAQALLFKTIMAALDVSTAGIGGSILSIFGLAKGGTVTNTGSGVSYSPHKKAAFGLNNFTVPGGYYKDNFLIGVQTGERVKVTPANQSGNENSSLSQVSNRLGSIEKAIQRMDANNMSKSGGMNVVNWQIGGRTLATILLKEMNQMSREGINLNEL